MAIADAKPNLILHDGRPLFPGDEEPQLIDDLRNLYRAYVRLLESGRDRIIALGGNCDSVEDMEASDPDLRRARKALQEVEYDLLTRCTPAVVTSSPSYQGVEAS